MKNFLSEIPQLLSANKDEIFVVNILACGIKAAYLKRADGRIELRDWSIMYFPDVRQTPDIDIVNFILTFAQKNSIKTKEVILSLSDLEGVVVKETVLPSTGEDDGPAIKFQLAEEIHFDANLAQVAWRHLGEIKNDDGSRQLRVLALIIDRNLINRFVDLIELCRFYTTVITSHVFHWENILKEIQGVEEVTAILDAQYDSTTLNVFVGGQLYFSRILSINLKRLAETLEGKDTIDPSATADKLIQKLFHVVFPSISEKETDGASNRYANYQRLRPLLEIFGRDIQLSFNYLTSQYHVPVPQQIFVTGVGGNFEHLIAFLGEKFALRTTHFPAAHLFIVSEQNSVSIQYAQNTIINLTAVALGDHEKFNLLPAEFRTKKIEKFQKLMLVAISAVVLAVFLLLIGRFHVKGMKDKAALTAAYQRLEELEEVILLNKQIVFRQDLNNRILAKEIPIDGLLKQISVSIPKEMVLKRILVDTVGEQVRIEGMIGKGAQTKDALVTKFSQSLEASPFFGKSSVTESQVIEDIFQFQITCELPHG